MAPFLKRNFKKARKHPNKKPFPLWESGASHWEKWRFPGHQIPNYRYTFKPKGNLGDPYWFGSDQPIVYQGPPEKDDFSFPQKDMAGSKSRSRGRSRSPKMDTTPGGVDFAARSRSRAAKSTATPGRRSKSRKLVKRYGAVTSKSSGFFKSRRRIRRDNVEARISKLGAYKVWEYGSTITSPSCVWVGHHDMPVNKVKEVVFLAMTRKLLDKVGGASSIKEIGAPIPWIQVGDKIQVNFRRTNDDGNAQITTAALPAGSPLADVAKALELAFDNGASGWQQELVPVSMEYLPGSAISAFARPNLVMAAETMIFEFDCKSSFKIQNRSSNGVDDDADDVDNIPLYGKSYYGKSNGLNMGIIRNTLATGYPGRTPFFANNTYGTYMADGAMYGANHPLNEPLLPVNITGAVKTGKAHLDPGQIKTSVLIDRFKISYKKLFPMLYKVSARTAPVAVNPQSIQLGKSRVFALEKMLEAVNIVGDRSPIVVAFEHNFRLGCALTAYSSRSTIQAIETLT